MKSELRISLDQGGRLGILGSSLGGLISCYAGWTRAIYGRIGCMSSSFWWNSQDFLNQVMKTHSVPSSKPLIYMDSGTEGGEAIIEAATASVKIQMIADGYRDGVSIGTYVEQGASHNRYYWGDRFYKPMTFLYPPSI